MGLRNWLYGPILIPTPNPDYQIAPLTMNVDDLRDFWNALTAGAANKSISASPSEGTPSDKEQTCSDIDALLALPPYQRGIISLRAGHGDEVQQDGLLSYKNIQNTTATFSDIYPGRVINDALSGESTANLARPPELMERAFAILAAQSTRHLSYVRRVWLVRAGIWAALAAVLTVACIQLDDVHFVALLCGLAITLAAVGYVADRQLRRRVVLWLRARCGQKLDTVSRAQLLEDRRNRRRDRRVVLYSTIPLLAVGAALNGLFRFWIR